MTDPMARVEFEGLLNDRESAREALRQVDIKLTAARRRSIEPVTRETLSTEQTFSLGRRARREGKLEVVAAVHAWHARQDQAALEIILEALNAEAAQ